MAEPKRSPPPASGLRDHLGIVLILIVDTAPGAAKALKRRLVELGATPQNVDVVERREEATKVLGSKAYGIFFGAHELGEHELPDMHGHQAKVVIVSTNTSQALASEGVRKRADAFLIKPFGPFVLEALLKRIFERELEASDYLKTIDSGEAALALNDIETANLRFTQAIEQSRRPALAHECLARVALKWRKPEAAIESYRKALLESRVHYASLTGLEKCLHSHEEVYPIVKRLALYFPTDPARLSHALRLAIVTGNLVDLDEYCDIFDCLPSKPKDLVEHLGSALVVAGRHLIEHEREEKGFELFARAVGLNSGTTRFLRRIVEVLVLLERREEARDYLTRFSKDSHASPDYVACDFLVGTDPGDPDSTIAGVEDLLKQGIKTPGLYEAILRAGVRIGDFDETSRRLEEAKKLWPHRAEDFDKAAGD